MGFFATDAVIKNLCMYEKLQGNYVQTTIVKCQDLNSVKLQRFSFDDIKDDNNNCCLSV